MVTETAGYARPGPLPRYASEPGMTVTPGPGGHGRARSGRALMAADPGVTAGPALAATAYSSSPACIVSGHDSESPAVAAAARVPDRHRDS